MFQYKPDYIDRMKPAYNILHIGASYGQETQAYLDKFKNTLQSITYIEPIPDVFNKLETYMNEFRKDVPIDCIQALISNVDNQDVDLYISNNDGLSSSMYPKNDACWAWDGVNFPNILKLKTTTLNTLMNTNPKLKSIDTLIIDVQGAELLVLEGLTNLLPSIQQIICEFSEREFYKGAVLVNQLESFLHTHNFTTERLGSDHGDLICFKSY